MSETPLATPRRPLRLKWHLVGLVLAAIAPLLIFTAIFIREDLQERRRLLDRGMRETARALSHAIDREINTSFGILETLAASRHLDTGDLKGFHELCVRAIATRKNAWIVLFDRSGQQIVNSSRPFGSPLPNPFRATKGAPADPRYPNLPLGGAVPVKKVFETGQPVVSDLFVALDSGQPTIGVGIPIIRDGVPLYVLEMSVDRHALLRLLLDQNLPADSVAAILDSKGFIIARTVDSVNRLGTRAAPELAAHIERAPEGSEVGHTSEGERVHHVFTRSTLTGWTISLGVSEAVLIGPMRRWFALIAGGATLAAVVGLAVAVILGRRIASPLARLAAAAEMMARGDRVEQISSGVREVEDLRGALVTAGGAVRQAATEREARLAAEAKRVEAQAANQMKDDFIALLSHELRTPLTSILGWARMLTAKTDDEAQRQRGLEVIERNAALQARLVDDLLDISRFSRGDVHLDLQPLDLDDVIVAALDSARTQAAANGLTLEHEFGTPGVVIVAGDRNRLLQIVGNLLANAVKFTPAGGRIAVRLERAGSSARIRVTDTGKGIPGDVLPHIFNPFYRGERVRGQGGLGLGLAIVRRLVEAHGGSIEAESAGGGRGATFTVVLPLAHYDE